VGTRKRLRLSAPHSQRRARLAPEYAAEKHGYTIEWSNDEHTERFQMRATTSVRSSTALRSAMVHHTTTRTGRAAIPTTGGEEAGADDVLCL
jgi:hypothetical protein